VFDDNVKEIDELFPDEDAAKVFEAIKPKLKDYFKELIFEEY